MQNYVSLVKMPLKCQIASFFIKLHTIPKNGLMNRILLLFLLGIGTLFSQTRPTVLYVDGSFTGSTAADGSEAFPFKTIRGALDYRGNVLGIAGMVSDEEIIVKAGTYAPSESEMIFLTATNGGKDGYRFTLRAEGGVYIDGSNLYTKKFASLIAITAGAENVKVQGFKLKGLRNNQSLASMVNGVLVKDGKFGIQVANTVKDVEITDNEIYDFSWTLDVDPMKNRLDFTPAEIAILKSADPGDNSGAINVVGTDNVPITGLVIRNNYIHNVIPGWTEGIQVNGNVDGFEVSGNIITEVQNIGIVAAGHYGWVPEIEGATVTAAFNYARNGVIKNNKVSSCRSPIAAAAGIYCDGSQNVIVENNTSSEGQVGFSIGNENSNVSSGGHTLRNNLAYGNAWTGIVVGVPAAASNSYIDGVEITGNTVFRNGGVPDTYLGNMGASEFIVQKNIKNLKIENNIFYADNHNTLVSFAMPFDAERTSDIGTISFDYNLYFTNSTEATPLGVFDWSQLGAGFDYYGTFEWYRVNRTDQDVHSSFADPRFTDTTPTSIDLILQNGSAAINAGNPTYVSAPGETDFYGNDRIAEERIDIGAYESSPIPAGNGAATIDGIKSAGEGYEPLVTGVVGSSFSNIYGYVDNEYIYLYAEIEASDLSEYNVYINTNGATGFQYLWTDRSDYFIDANYSVLNEHTGGSSGWPFTESPSSTGIEFLMTSEAVEGKIKKSLIGLGNSGTIGIGLEGHTANWGSSRGGVPISGNMVYLNLDSGISGNSVKARIEIEEVPSESEEVPLGIYPNPAQDQIHATFSLASESQVMVEVISMDNKTHLNKKMWLGPGLQQIAIPLERIRRGMYILRITSPGKVETKSILVR